MSSVPEISYITDFLSKENSLRYFNEFKNYGFEYVNSKIKGKIVKSTRQVIAFGDSNCAAYSFSGSTPHIHAWTPMLIELKNAVESACNNKYNYALLNYYSDGKVKIAPHQDNDLSLNIDISIATISLGATRTIVFSKKDTTSFKQTLEDASLLIMQPSVNQDWLHAIPSDSSVSEPRISISFRSIKELCQEREPTKRTVEEMDSTLDSMTAYSCEAEPHAKQKCFEEKLLDMSFENFFSSIPTTSAFNEKQRSNRTVFKKDLGDSIYLSCELFKNELKVHIRKFDKCDRGYFYPTKQGITMDLKTWYEFHEKLFSFNLYYTSSSFIANNTILVLNNMDIMHIEYFSLNEPLKSKFIELNYFQFHSLKEIMYEFNSNIIEFVLTTHFASLASDKCEVLYCLSDEEEDNLLTTFILSVEKELISHFPKWFKCDGCIIQHPSQFRHDCIVKSNLEKFHTLGENSLLLVNAEDLVHHFSNTVISQTFLNRISVSFVKDVLFQKSY